VFPDIYSLLLWIWTFQLFDNVYVVRPKQGWRKYFYRGESTDYGATQFSPSIARQNNSGPARSRRVCLDLLGAIREYVFGKMALGRTSNTSSLHRFLIETMSSSQAIAVAQHYGFPTPMLDVTVNPEVAAYFATLPSKSDIRFLGYLDTSNNSGFANVALVMAPSVFTRIQRQNGYFITMPPGKDYREIFTILRFHHRLDCEPFKPTWVANLGFIRTDGTDVRKVLLEDSYGLEEHLKRRLWELMESSNTRVLHFPTIEAMSSLQKTVIPELCFAAGRYGILESGQRFVELNGALLFSVLRYAPFYGFIQGVALQVLAETYGGSFEVLFKSIINVMRTMISTGISAEIRENMGWVRPEVATQKDIMGMVAEIVIDGDPNEMPWPLCAWYE